MQDIYLRTPLRRPAHLFLFPHTNTTIMSSQFQSGYTRFPESSRFRPTRSQPTAQTHRESSGPRSTSLPAKSIWEGCSSFPDAAIGRDIAAYDAIEQPRSRSRSKYQAYVRNKSSENSFIDPSSQKSLPSEAGSFVFSDELSKKELDEYHATRQSRLQLQSHGLRAKETPTINTLRKPAQRPTSTFRNWKPRSFLQWTEVLILLLAAVWVFSSVLKGTTANTSPYVGSHPQPGTNPPAFSQIEVKPPKDSWTSMTRLFDGFCSALPPKPTDLTNVPYATSYTYTNAKTIKTLIPEYVLEETKHLLAFREEAESLIQRYDTLSEKSTTTNWFNGSWLQFRRDLLTAIKSWSSRLEVLQHKLGDMKIAYRALARATRNMLDKDHNPLLAPLKTGPRWYEMLLNVKPYDHVNNLWIAHDIVAKQHDKSIWKREKFAAAVAALEDNGMGHSQASVGSRPDGVEMVMEALKNDLAMSEQ